MLKESSFYFPSFSKLEQMTTKVLHTHKNMTVEEALTEYLIENIERDFLIQNSMRMIKDRAKLRRQELEVMRRRII